jgi:hypothetical protein
MSGPCAASGAGARDYALSVDLGPEWKQAVAEADASLHEMSAEECVACAAFVRDFKVHLTTDRQVDIAEETACRFETRAATKAAHR